MVETKRICNGTFGEVWLDGSYVGECYKAQGKVEFNKEEIKQCGTWWTDNKVGSCISLEYIKRSDYKGLRRQ